MPGDGHLTYVAKLFLYHYQSCWYCMKVRRVIDELGIDVELRDVRRDPTHRADLLEARGRGTVPVLRIDRGDGEDEWMPESADIVDFLREGSDLPLCEEGPKKARSGPFAFLTRRS